jgi:hypothetical protein
VTAPALHGVLAEFSTPAEILAAARRLGAAGFRRMDAYTPFPVAGLDEAMRPAPGPALPLLVLAGAVLGAAAGYFVQYWAEAISYPINVGGRPYDSWPAFTVSSFEATVLCGLAAGFVAFLAFCRLPRLCHPVFAAAAFERASQDRFFLCVEHGDPAFDPDRLRRLFAELGALSIAEVAA